MKIITINLTERQVRALAVLQDLGLYPSRSEAIRVAIRDFLFEKYLSSMVEPLNGQLEPMIAEQNEELEAKKKEIGRLLQKLSEEAPEVA